MIIMLSGKQGAGKSAAADDLQKALEEKGCKVVRYKFAQPLYDMHEAIYKVAETYGIERHPEGKDGPLLQVLGTEWGRKTKGYDIWINAARAFVRKVQTDGFDCASPSVIIDDLRFQNEFDAFPGAFRVRLECAEPVRKTRTHCWRENSTHQSEVDLDGYAEEGRFDLVCDTGWATREEVTAMIMNVITNSMR